MSRYFCHAHPDVLTVATRAVDARPGAVLLADTPFHPGGGGQLHDRGVVRWIGGEIDNKGRHNRRVYIGLVGVGAPGQS
jgi:misacylated tRNA(Ala) deacylase